jgi:hypothetical protein
MFCTSRKIPIAIYLLLASSLLTAQTAPVKQVAPIYIGPGKWAPAPQELYAPYWTLEPGWSTELEIRNNLTRRELRVTPVLRTTDGNEALLAPVTLQPDEIVAVNLEAAVAAAKPELLGRTGAFGSVVFRFDANSASNAFAAAVVRREGHPIDFHFDAYDTGSTAVEGIWYLPTENSTSYLILSNPTVKPVTARLILSDASGATHPLSLRLGPGQSQRLNVREVFRAAVGGAVGGLSLSVAKDGALSATEIVFDEITGFAAIMKLFDREPTDKAENRVLRAPMMALSQPDSSLGLPSGTALEPKIFLRNSGSVPTAISPGVHWRNDSSAGTAALPKVTLSPGQVRIMSLADFQKAGLLTANATWATVTLAYTGRRADLVAVAMSYDKPGRHGLQTPFIEGTNRLFKGSMWHVDATHNTLITTGNGGTEQTRAQATLYYNGGQGKYRVEKLLLPGQQLWLDVGQLARNQVPDSDGKVIPPDIMFGSYELRDLEHPLVGLLYEGKLVIDKTYGHAAYGCARCCGWGSAILTPSPFGGPPGIDNTDVAQAPDECQLGDMFDVTSYAYGWNSSNTAVAKLPTRTLHTVAPGTARGATFVKLQNNDSRVNCPAITWNPGQGVTVLDVGLVGGGYIFVGSDSNIVSRNDYQVTNSAHDAGPQPSGGTGSAASSDASDTITQVAQYPPEFHFQTPDQSTNNGDRTLTFTYSVSGVGSASVQTSVTARKFAYVTNNSPYNACTLGYGTDRTYIYTVYTHPDKTAVQANDALTNTPVNEGFNPALTCKTVTGSGALNANGQFTDHVASACSSSPLTCTQTSTQTINVAGYPVRTNTLQWTSTGVTYTSNGPNQ